jgi:hypothetical protein
MSSTFILILIEEGSTNKFSGENILILIMPLSSNLKGKIG